ncbi:ABC transporter substrate-binding protein [Rhodococcoides kyotonense]|uniref:Peptide/nickel transport system substrate-binding protein n=1 Tax=Rhodococcoides kyotonense TaxID=398843 RepID=A0A239N0W8_9NOCA|nr:ABC transporter substrate-binding protein [Rhodococcus kyotonensis]SNT47828.1 peptide/nickel transport system substrate-binding protein [Rhodococcus kyotonensis]
MRFRSFVRPGIRLTTAAAATILVLAAGLTGCSSATDADAKVLTVAASVGPTSLDPMLQAVDQINNMYINLAYDSLTRIDGNGEVVPDLATRWEYTDDTQTVLAVTLRDGVRFSDGFPMTAESVAKSLDYGRTKGVNGPNWLGSVTSVTPANDNTVLITSSEPNDALPFLLSQRMLLGSVVSEDGLGDPQSLKRGTYGAGPYMLDYEQTISNDTYVYVPNPHYWDDSRIKWDKVVIKVVGNYSAALQAVQSGAADLFSADRPTAAAARERGLSVATAPFGLTGIGYLDRAGETVPALGDPRVRQALNYAIDRPSISDAVFKDFSVPNASLVLNGFPGYDPQDVDAFAFDLDKAKQLLVEAGYPDGFTFEMSAPTSNNTNLVAQAVIENWAKIGVNANLTTYTDLGQLRADVIAKKFPVVAFNYGALPTYVQAKSFFTGGANQYNPWKVSNPQVDAALHSGAVALDDDSRNAAYADAWRTALVDQAWFSNVYVRDQVTVYDPTRVSGVDITTQNPVVDLAWTVNPTQP